MDDFIGGFISGFFFCMLIGSAFLASCENTRLMSDVIHGVKYDNKIYHAVIDSARTDSLHNWRKEK